MKTIYKNANGGKFDIVTEDGRITYVGKVAEDGIDNYRKVTETAYAGGTIVGILVMQRDYDLCKKWALELADICDMIGVE